jgi:tetratricopeptide (TPR) repeat protein
MTAISFTDRFPEMEPVHAAPSLVTINGFGTTLCGSRDRDEETGTYVATRCLCAIFIPLFALAAYRVAHAGGNEYYFVGKQPLSALAKAWNVLIVLALVAAVGYFGFTGYYYSEEAVAGRDLAAAERHLAAGEHSEAIAKYEKVAGGLTSQATVARQSLYSWLAAPPAAAKPQDKQAAWQAAVRLTRGGKWNQSQQELADRGLALAAEFVASAPDVAINLLDESANIDGQAKASAPKRRELLQTLHAARPGDMQVTVRLATALEAEENVERAVSLLLPLREQLGDTEGARILGQHLVASGKFDEAYPLLMPYCQSRLAQFRSTEESFTTAYESVLEAALNRLRNDQAPRAFYHKYERANEDEQQRMVDEYIEEAVKADSQFAALRETFIKEAQIVPVALDLGLVQLQRAQTLEDQAARKAELEQAEKTFLSVGNTAGDSDEYQLNLGKVYYWLGKQKEGRKLFDAILARNAKNFDIRIALARILREVGAEGEARELAEKIFKEESDPEHKSAAASMRSLLARESDEEILWLSRCRQSDPEVKASLCLARARKAIKEANDGEAQVQLRQAVALYEAMPESSPSLNNAAIGYDGLFNLVGDAADLRKAAELFDKAISLQPDDSILLFNTAGTFQKLAVAETLGHLVDLRLMGMTGDLDLLRLCYYDQRGHDELVARLREHPALGKAMTYYDRSLLLAPKRASNYLSAVALYAVLEDAAALERTSQRALEAQPDLKDLIEEMQRYARGERDKEIRTQSKRRTAQARQLAEEWRKQPASERRSRSLAGALDAEASAILGAAPIGEKVDWDAVVKLAEQALAEHRCSATHRGLIAALVCRASAQLERAQPKYKAFAAAGRRSLSPYELVLVALERPMLQELVAKHPDIRRAAELVAQSCARFPMSGSIDDALLLAPFDPSASQLQFELAQADEAARLATEISYRLLPASPHAGLEMMRQLAADGKQEEAAEIRKQLARYKMVLP